MAPKDNDKSLLELCPRVTDLANRISSGMVEYLAISHHQTHGFRQLAIHFLEVCQTLWPIQAGLLNNSRADGQLPPEVALELKRKVVQTIEDFSSLDLLLSKFLIYEKKKGLSKFSKSLGLMFVDSDIHRLSESLIRDRDTLRMGALAFQWALGETNTYSSMGNAYANLAAVLRIANTSSTTVSTTGPRVPEKHLLTKEVTKPIGSINPGEWNNTRKQPISTVSEISVMSPKVLAMRNTTDTLVESQTPSLSAFPTPGKLPSPQNSISLRKSPPITELAQFHFEHSSNSDIHSDQGSQATTESLIHFEEMLRSYEYDRTSRLPIVHHEPRTTSRTKQVPDTNVPATRQALVVAVQQRNHKVVEELLNLGVAPESVTDVNLLSQAIANEDGATTRLLLLFGADANRLDINGSTPLQAATELGAVESAKMLLKYGADLHLSSGPDEDTPLGTAAAHGRTELIHLYISHGADPNAMMESGETAFVKSIHKRASTEVVELMLSSGANPNLKTREGKTALLEALLVKRADLVKILLENGANPNLPGPKHPLWPGTYNPTSLKLLLDHGADVKKAPGIMELAASLNCIESIKILLKARVNPNIKKDGVYTPLCSAIRDDRPEIVTLLLANGADPNLKASEYPAWKCITHDHLHFLPQLVQAGADLHNPKGILETAVAFHHKEALTYLLNHGVNPNDNNEEGYTPLTTAIRDNSDQFVDLLLAHGASPTVRGQDWPLSMAVKRPAILKKLLPKVPSTYKAKGIIERAVVANQLESVKLLVMAGFSVEDKTGGVFSPLTSALREKHVDIVEYLLDDAGADVNAPGEHLPIIKAIRRCDGPHDLGAIEMLLARKADINKVYRGWNAVMQAIETGCPAVLRLLIEKGGPVDLNAVDETGKTVREFVEERGWHEGTILLLGST